jgi:hypothetical protein
MKIQLVISGTTVEGTLTFWEWLRAYPDFIAAGILAPHRRVARDVRKGDSR